MQPPTSLLGVEKLNFVLKHLREVEGLDGVVIEIGVYKGGTLYAMAQATTLGRKLFGYDTFTGLPSPSEADLDCSKPHAEGDFSDVDMDEIQAHMPGNVTLVKGLYPPAIPDDGPVRNVVFAHLDVDQYASTFEALGHLAFACVDDARVVVDDYNWHRTPGVALAVRRIIEILPHVWELHASNPHQVCLRRRSRNGG